MLSNSSLLHITVYTPINNNNKLFMELKDLILQITVFVERNFQV